MARRVNQTENDHVTMMDSWVHNAVRETPEGVNPVEMYLAVKHAWQYVMDTHGSLPKEKLNAAQLHPEFTAALKKVSCRDNVRAVLTSTFDKVRHGFEHAGQALRVDRESAAGPMAFA